MDFGEALEFAEKGIPIKRKGWNGKNQYVVIAYVESVTLITGEKIDFKNHEDIGNKVLVFVGTSGMQCGWLASQADMLANDWEVAETEGES